MFIQRKEWRPPQICTYRVLQRSEIPEIDVESGGDDEDDATISRPLTRAAAYRASDEVATLQREILSLRRQLQQHSQQEHVQNGLASPSSAVVDVSDEAVGDEGEGEGYWSLVGEPTVPEGYRIADPVTVNTHDLVGAEILHAFEDAHRAGTFVGIY